MTILGIILVIVAVVVIIQGIRTWGPTDKSKAIAGVLWFLALVLLYFSGAFAVLGARP